MVLECVSDRLVETVADEIGRGQPVVLANQPLINAQSREFVRQTQERLIGAPILQRLKTQHGEQDVEPRLLALLGGWRGHPPQQSKGTGPGTWPICCASSAVTCVGSISRDWRFGRCTCRAWTRRTPAWRVLGWSGQ